MREAEDEQRGGEVLEPRAARGERVAEEVRAEVALRGDAERLARALELRRLVLDLLRLGAHRAVNSRMRRRDRRTGKRWLAVRAADACAPAHGPVAAAGVRRAREELTPGTELFHIVDESLLNVTRKTGALTAVTRRRVLGYLESAAEAGADLVLVTCSSIGPAVDAAHDFVPRAGAARRRADGGRGGAAGYARRRDRDARDDARADRCARRAARGCGGAGCGRRLAGLPRRVRGAAVGRPRPPRRVGARGLRGSSATST